jgi:RNA polymerase sigma factor (sigma-70 family)
MTAALSHWSGIGPGSSDGEIAVAAAAGDRNAFALIYDRYADRLHDFCVGMLRDRDSAADCVQDAFCIVSTSLGGLREPDKLRPWLYSIVRNEAHKRLRELKRERPSDEMPEVVSHDAGPDTMAQRLELANLISEAAGGLSERDQAVLELAYRQGLDGPELAMALGVTQTNANTMVGRLRDTIERSLGALLVARRIQANPASCPELASVLHGWDGKFNILMRKRIARHIESCDACEDLRRRSVSPAALLGAPVFIPAPAWLKNSVMRDFELTSASHNMTNSSGPPTQMRPQADSGFHAAATAARPALQPPLDPPPAAPQYREQPAAYVGTVAPEESKRRVVPLMALLIGLPILVLGGTLAWLYLPSVGLTQSGVVQPAPQPTAPASVPSPTPAAVLPTPQAPKATPAPAPAQAPRPAAPLPSPQAKPPAPQQAPPVAPPPPAQAPPPVQAPAPVAPPVAVPPPVLQPPVGQLPFPLPRLPLPQNPAGPARQLPAQAPPQQVPAQQAPAQQAPAQQAPAQQAPAQQAPAQQAPAQQAPAQQAPAQQAPAQQAPAEEPIPVGPAPKKVDPAPDPGTVQDTNCTPGNICVK